MYLTNKQKKTQKNPTTKNILINNFSREKPKPKFYKNNTNDKTQK